MITTKKVFTDSNNVVYNILITFANNICFAKMHIECISDTIQNANCFFKKTNNVFSNFILISYNATMIHQNYYIPQ